MSDPEWFYSSLAQSSAAIIGFFGGFLIYRVLNQIGSWRDLLRRFDELEFGLGEAWGREQTNTADRLVRELIDLDNARASESFPGEFCSGAALLLALTGVGIVWPLLAITEPTTSTKAMMLVPWIVLILASFGFLLGRARRVLKDLHKRQRRNRDDLVEMFNQSVDDADRADKEREDARFRSAGPSD